MSRLVLATLCVLLTAAAVSAATTSVALTAAVITSSTGALQVAGAGALGWLCAAAAALPVARTYDRLENYR